MSIQRKPTTDDDWASAAIRAMLQRVLLAVAAELTAMANMLRSDK